MQMMRITPAARRIRETGLAVSLALLLSACAGQVEPPVTVPSVPQPPTPRADQPMIRPTIQSPSTPARPPATQRSHPRYAPPPGAPAHWDNQLGVYVVDGTKLYYRERLFYRWDGEWQCSGRAAGPWEPVPLESVPQGLRNRR